MIGILRNRVADAQALFVERSNNSHVATSEAVDHGAASATSHAVSPLR
jgi:hypothetical protein